MRFQETGFKGLYVIEPLPFEDDRGLFYRVFCKKEFRSIGLDKEFVQVNQSVNHKKGTFRGIHYQLPPNEDDKLVRCIQGKVLDIVVDIRKNSKTFLQWFKIELSAANRKMLFIPKGFGHGFLTLENNSMLNYYHTAFYEPGCEGALNVLDPQLQINLDKRIDVISDKDMKIANINSEFKGI